MQLARAVPGKRELWAQQRAMNLISNSGQESLYVCVQEANRDAVSFPVVPGHDHHPPGLHVLFPVDSLGVHPPCSLIYHPCGHVCPGKQRPLLFI